MTCSACTEAAANPLTGSYFAGCRECEARAIAQSPAAFKAMRAITAVDLQDAIAKFFGAPGSEGYEHGRQRVWYWINAVKAAKEKT